MAPTVMARSNGSGSLCQSKDGSGSHGPIKKNGSGSNDPIKNGSGSHGPIKMTPVTMARFKLASAPMARLRNGSGSHGPNKKRAPKPWIHPKTALFSEIEMKLMKRQRNSVFAAPAGGPGGGPPPPPADRFPGLPPDDESDGGGDGFAVTKCWTSDGLMHSKLITATQDQVRVDRAQLSFKGGGGWP